MERFLSAMLQSQWAEAAQWLDTPSLRQLRREILNSPWRWSPPYVPTVADIMQSSPDMPREVAEYLVRSTERSANLRPPIAEFGLESVQALSNMSPDSLAGAWVKARDVAHHARESARRQGCDLPPALDSMLRARRPMVMGAVFQDSTRAFVLYALNTQPPSTQELRAPLPHVAALNRGSAGWRIQPRDDLAPLGHRMNVCVTPR